MEIVIIIFMLIALLFLPGAGILAYYKRWNVMFYIASIVSTIIWAIGTISSFSTLLFFGVFLIAIPFVIAAFLKQKDGYSYFLFSACFGAYLTAFYLYLYAEALGRWSI